MTFFFYLYIYFFVYLLSALRRRATKAEIEESLTDGTKTCIVRCSRGRLPAKQGNRCKATVSKIRKNSKPKAMGKQECLNPTEKAEILERTAFESRKPFFKMVMQPTYIGAVKGYPNYMVSFSVYCYCITFCSQLHFCSFFRLNY